jgi:exodeoxyribonuclease VIII
MKPAPEPGLYFDVPFEEYASWDAVSNSQLSPAAKSMLHYREQEPREETPAMHFGKIIHAGKLDPATLLDNFAVMPDFTPQLAREYERPRASKEWKALEATWREKIDGKEVVSPDEMDRLRGVLTALSSHARAAAYFARGRGEVSVVWRDVASGLPCKGRPDWWDERAGAIVDLKTTVDPGKFETQMARLSYHQQGAFYADGMFAVTHKPCTFHIVAVESDRPFGVRAAPLSLDSYLAGREEYLALLLRISECRKSGDWPGYEDPDEWNLPEWALPQTELTIAGRKVAV